MPSKTIENSEKIQTPSDTVSYAIDCNDDSYLLESREKEDAPATMEHREVVPSTSAIHSLFSENKLLLDQD